MLRGSRTAGRAGRGVLCVLLAASWSGVAGTLSQPARAHPAQGAPAQRPAARGGDPVAIVAGLRARVDRLVAAARQASNEPLDPTALVARVGRDPAALTRWIREQVRFEPYAGFMKGARGAIVSRRANSADKALLLAEALQAGGVKARLVRGKIDPKTLPAVELPPRENSPEPDAAALNSFSASSGIPAARLQSLLNEGRAQRQEVAEDLWTRFQRDFDVVAGQLQAANLPPPPAPAFAPPDEHWWVRTDAGDLDPTAEAKSGAQEAAVFELNKLPADAFHTLTVRMKIKRDDGTESVVL